MLEPKTIRTAFVFILLLVVASCADRRSPTLIGDWSSTAEKPKTMMYMVIKQDHTFALGDVIDGKRLKGLTGRWQAEGEWLTLDVETSECCKIPEGTQMKWRYRLVDKDELTLYAPNGEDSTNAETLHRAPKS